MQPILSLYLEPVLTSGQKRGKLLSRLVENIVRSELLPDAIAVTGLSGLLVAVPICERIKDLELIVVRKPKEDCHSYMTVEGYAVGRTYVIVDDGVCRGHTVRRIIQAIIEYERFSHYDCAGIFTYSDEVHSDRFGRAVEEELRIPVFNPKGECNEEVLYEMQRRVRGSRNGTVCDVLQLPKAVSENAV